MSFSSLSELCVICYWQSLLFYLARIQSADLEIPYSTDYNPGACFCLLVLDGINWYFNHVMFIFRLTIYICNIDFTIIQGVKIRVCQCFQICCFCWQKYHVGPYLFIYLTYCFWFCFFFSFLLTLSDRDLFTCLVCFLSCVQARNVFIYFQIWQCCFFYLHLTCVKSQV